MGKRQRPLQRDLRIRCLIVNGDDLGASEGINRGIFEAHSRGVLTSASLMVDQPASVAAAALSQRHPQLSVGLHVQLTDEDYQPLLDLHDTARCRAELRRQLRIFRRLLGQDPTHLDAHHNIQRDAELSPVFEEFADELGVPLRERSGIRYLSSFYGQWDDGVTHLEQVSVASLVRLVETEVPQGITELGCHPGYVDGGFSSSYAMEREHELRTLCDPTLRDALCREGIRLISFREISSLRRAFQGAV